MAPRRTKMWCSKWLGLGKPVTEGWVESLKVMLLVLLLLFLLLLLLLLRLLALKFLLQEPPSTWSLLVRDWQFWGAAWFFLASGGYLIPEFYCDGSAPNNFFL